MIKNYFILNRFVSETRDVLVGNVITEIFSQEKDQLVFRISSGSEDIFLEISANPALPYIRAADDFRRAKKNSIDFFEEYLPAEIKDFEIAGSDRILRLTLPSSKIYFMIRGKYTDVFLQDEYFNALFFKKYPDESTVNLSAEMNSTRFVKGINVPDINISRKENIFEEIKERYPFVGKEILIELKARYSPENKSGETVLLKKIIEEVLTEEAVVSFDPKLNVINLSVKTFCRETAAEEKFFPDINSAINFYIGKKYYLDSLSLTKKKIQKHVDREIAKISRKLNDIKTLLERGSKEEYYSKAGNLLLININKIKPGMKEIDLEDIYENNNTANIKLDVKLSPQKNAERYFEKAKSYRILIERSKAIFKDLNVKLKKFKDTEAKVESEENLTELHKIMKELKIKDQADPGRPDDIKSKFKHYIIENKYHLYVGKDSSNNDLLTTKFAKQNDYWFHARSVSGSHAVLRVENSKEPVPKSVLKKAAALAALHSKAKTSGMAPVSYTFKKYVIKKKGMEAGKVALLKEDVLIVKPEVPAGCEYVQND